jgi:hypothetical protein
MYIGKSLRNNLENFEIRDLDVSGLVNSRTGLGTRQFTFANEYYVFAYPSRFGDTPLIKLNNINSTNFIQTSMSSFINNAGGTDDYYVYYSTNRLVGTFQIQIQ